MRVADRQHISVSVARLVLGPGSAEVIAFDTNVISSQV